MRGIGSCVAWGLVSLIAIGAAAQDSPPTGNSLKSVVNSAEAIPKALPKTEAVEPEKQTPEELAKTAGLLLKVGQLMVVRLEGRSGPSPADRQLLEQVPPGAVLLPRLMPAETLSAYVGLLRGRPSPSGQPLMIGIDLIGAAGIAGPGPSPGMRVPAMLTTAASGATALTAAMYAAQAADLAALGFDFHWGPALGLAPSIQTSAVWGDSFGSLPVVTAAFASQIGGALGQKNLAWAPGNFPGGTTDAGQRAPAVLLTPRSQLRELDLKPYEAAIAAGAELMHVGTTLVPTIDSERPACLSNIVIRDVLRDALDFDGLVIAGPMDSPEVSRISDTSTAAVEALISGADMIYWNGSGPRVARAIVDIVQGVEKGIIPESIVNDAFTRVVAYKERRGLAQWPAPDPDQAREVAKSAAKRREAAEIERHAITLLRNRDEVLPLVKEKSEMIGITGAYGVQELQTALEEYFKTVAAQAIRNARHATRIQDFEIARLTRPGSPIKTAIVVMSGDIELVSQLKLIRGLKLAGQRIVVVLLGQPRNVQAYEDADALILAYGDVTNPAETMTAVADMLAGNAPVEVLAPVRELEIRAGEAATFDVHDVVRSPTGRLPISLGEPFVAGFAVSYRSGAVVEGVRWDFGDGKQSRDPITSHAYKKPGTYEITLRVGKKFPGEGKFRVVVK